MADRISRREFLKETAVAGAAAVVLGSQASEAAGTMQTRTLGKTGARVSIVALGCGSRLLSYGNEDAGVNVLNRALDAGISYFDTAYGYGDGQSEIWVGKVARNRRKEFFLATKVEPRDGDAVMRLVEGSLKRLQTERIDLIHVHGLQGEDDLAKVEAKNGVMNALYKLREQKVTRFIGITSHSDPAVLKTAIEHNDIDCVQMALNAGMQGMPLGPHDGLNRSKATSFQDIALPAARKKNLGILAMKVMGQEGLLGPGPDKSDAGHLLRYTLSLPIAAAVVGMPTLEMLQQNVAWGKLFTPMSKGQMEEFSSRIASGNKLALDLKFSNHRDA